METIHKFSAKHGAKIEIPNTFLILSLQLQRGEPVFWAAVETEAEKVRFRVVHYGTGHEVPWDDLIYIGTYQEGDFVWHVFLDEAL